MRTPNYWSDSRCARSSSAGWATDRGALVVQNIGDHQGDEIIRVVPLVQALLALNPLLEVVLVTARSYLYGHPRLSLVPIGDRPQIESLLRASFDVLVNFFESNVVDVSYDLDLARQIRTHVGADQPFIYLESTKGWNHFTYQCVEIAGRPYVRLLRLHRQRMSNVYETTYRLLAEFGLPLRVGEEAPRQPVIAGVPCHEAQLAWSDLVAGNAIGRPIVLLCPIGGSDPLKGYVDRKFGDLAELIAEGFYVVIQANGEAWGSAPLAHSVLGHLTEQERSNVMVVPDPAEGLGTDAHTCYGALRLPRASYAMHLVTHFVRFADLVVTIEGWMVHAAYCSGKPFRILMAPSSPETWIPYGRTVRQQVAIPARRHAWDRQADPDGAAPLAHQPWKFAQIDALRSLVPPVDAHGRLLLRWALWSEDGDIRTAATEALQPVPNGRAAPAERLLRPSRCRLFEIAARLIGRGG